MDEAGTSAWREINERRIQVALEITQGPGRMREVVQQRDIFDDARAVAKQSDGILVRRFIQIEFSVDIAEGRSCGWELMQQAAFVLPRLYGVLLAGKPVDDRDLHARLPDPIT